MVFVSSASVWEISIKQKLGKLEAPDNLLEKIRVHKFIPLHINADYAQLAGQLPYIHKDPFERKTLAKTGKIVSAYVMAILYPIPKWP